MKFELRRSHNLAGAMTYPPTRLLKGSASSETEDYPGSTPSRHFCTRCPLIDHLFNLNVNYSMADRSGPSMFGICPFENTVWDVVIRASSGAPCTNVARQNGDLYSEELRPHAATTYSIDLELSKKWKDWPDDVYCVSGDSQSHRPQECALCTPIRVSRMSPMPRPPIDRVHAGPELVRAATAGPA